MMIINNDANEDIILIAISEKEKENCKQTLVTDQIMEALGKHKTFLYDLPTLQGLFIGLKSILKEQVCIYSWCQFGYETLRSTIISFE